MNVNSLTPRYTFIFNFSFIYGDGRKGKKFTPDLISIYLYLETNVQDSEMVSHKVVHSMYICVYSLASISGESHIEHIN